MHINETGSTSESSQIPNTKNQQVQEQAQNNSIFAKFNDNNNIVDLSDVTYTNDAGNTSKPLAITNFLNQNAGKSWSTKLKQEVGQLINRFNLEQEGDNLIDDLDNMQESFDNFKDSVNSEFENFKKSVGIEFNETSKKLAPSTGDTVAVRNNDNTTSQINFKDKTITLYSSDGTVIEKRAMTEKEQTLSAAELIENLQKPDSEPQYMKAQFKSAPSTGETVAVRNNDNTTSQINFKDKTITLYSSDGTVIEKRTMTEKEQTLSAAELIENLQQDNRSIDEPNNPQIKPKKDVPVNQVNNNGVTGTYSLVTNKNGGYRLRTNFTVNSFENQAAQAFSKGLYNEFGLIDLKYDSNGQYTFRGLKSGSFNVLQSMVRQKGQQIAGYTEIYKDLQTKQDNGETLTAGEQKFMKDYNKMLNKFGLQINANGELEDLKKE